MAADVVCRYITVGTSKDNDKTLAVRYHEYMLFCISIKDYRTNRTITAAVKKAHRQYGRHTTYITALKQLMDASNEVSNKAVIEQCLEEAKTADAAQAADLYRYARYIGIMQNDEALYTQGLQRLLQGEPASDIISIIKKYRKNLLDRSDVLHALECNM